jgi:glutamine synthetase
MRARRRRPADPFDALEARMAADGVDFVRFEQTDLHGISRSKTVPARHVRSFAEGGLNFVLGVLGFDAQFVPATGTGYLEEVGFPDSRLRPELDTYRLLPWADRTARLLCEPYHMDGRPAMAAPRAVARRLLAELEAMDYRLLSGLEYEFYLVDRATRQPSFPGTQMFATIRNNFDEPFLYRVMRAMTAVGVDVITANAEAGPGQMEINFAPGTGIDAADHAFTFKNGVKEIAQRHGYVASFMTKPWADQPGNGCHYHQSLLDAKRGRSAFVAGPDRGMSAVARRWLGGQMAHAAALTALVAPTVNCAKRYKVDSMAPTNVTWGVENRSAAFRIKDLGRENVHIENRIPCGSANPYLIMAGMVAAGLDGLRRKLEPPAETTGVAWGREGVADLPTSLEQSLQAFEADAVLRDALGEELVHLFLAVKRHEIAKAKAAIPDYDAADFAGTVYEWERSEYFEFL